MQKTACYRFLFSIMLVVASSLAFAQDDADFEAFDLEGLEQRAQAGDVEAMRDLGMEYLFGSNVFQDGFMAEQWLTAAAEKGDAAAQTGLGYLYEEGIGLSANLKDAVK